MRKLFYAALLTVLAACSGGVSTPGAALDRAERACDQERYSLSQAICDSIVENCDTDSLSVRDMCRLSLLLMRLAEYNTTAEESNTAAAARYFHTAVDRNSDSTAMIVNTMPPEAMSRLLILSIISETSARRDSVSDLELVADTIPEELFYTHPDND